MKEVTASKHYRQAFDIEYTLLEYRRAKTAQAHDLAKRIRWANETLTTEFDLIDKQLALLPVDRPEGWDA